MLKVIYRRNDGTMVRTLAVYSYRRGPLGEWLIDGQPLSGLAGEVIYKGPQLSDAAATRVMNRAKPVMA